MAPSKKRGVNSRANMRNVKRPKIGLTDRVEVILESRKHANDVFDIFEVLEVK